MGNALNRRIAIVGAASSIGIRPYDGEREARHLDRAPAVLRELGIVNRLDAEDLGDVTPPSYRDFTRPPGGVRNETDLVEYSNNWRIVSSLLPPAAGSHWYSAGIAASSLARWSRLAVRGSVLDWLTSTRMPTLQHHRSP